MLWRHGRTAWNHEGRFQGQTDVGLDDAGRAQARRAAALLAAFPPTHLVSSDLSRAHDTAAELARLTGLAVGTDEGLRETHGGRWEGLLAAEIAETDGEQFGVWRAGGDVRPGGGETRQEVANRASAAVARRLDDLPDGEGVLVVATHGGTARALIGTLLALPLECWHALGGLANCSWSVLEETRAGGRAAWRLTEHNAGTLPEPVSGADDA